MVYNLGAIVNGGVVEGIIVIEPCSIPAVKESMGYERLIAVDDSVRVGDSYDEDKSVFLREGVRVFPQKTDLERIVELEAQVEDTQAALIELAGIIGGVSE